MAHLRAANHRVAFVLALSIFVVLGNCSTFTVCLLHVRLNAVRALFIILSLHLLLSELVLVLLSRFLGCFEDFRRFVEGNCCTVHSVFAEAGLLLTP